MHMHRFRLTARLHCAMLLLELIEYLFLTTYTFIFAAFPIDTSFADDAPPAELSNDVISAVDRLFDFAFSSASMSLFSSLESTAYLLGREMKHVSLAIGLGVTYYFSEAQSGRPLLAATAAGAVLGRSSDTEYSGFPLGFMERHPYWYDLHPRRFVCMWLKPFMFCACFH